MATTDTSDCRIPAEEQLERSHRIPIVATCVFVVTMLAIWLMGRQMHRHSAGAISDVRPTEILRSHPELGIVSRTG